MAHEQDAAEHDTASARYESTFTVTPADIDHLGHVNNLVYLRWVQDVAAAHWRAATTDEQRSRIEWVAVRHEIDYKEAALPGDDVVARTWVEEWTAVTSDRRTEIRRSPDGALLARARTIWCAVDPGSLKPRRVDPSVLVGFRVPAR